MNIKKPWMCLSVLMLATGVRAQDAAPQGMPWSALDLKLAGLGAWGARQYHYTSENPGRQGEGLSGTVTLTTEVTNETIVLRDKLQLQHQGQNISFEITHTCRKDGYLSPVRIESKGEGSDEANNFVATVANGNAIVRKDGRETTRDIPEGTITTAAMMRLVTLLPRGAGRSYTYKHSLESEELNLKKDYQLSVLPQETIMIDGRRVEATRFKLTGGGINPVFYWVGNDGVLLRVMIDGRKVMELRDKR